MSDRWLRQEDGRWRRLRDHDAGQAAVDHSVPATWLDPAHPVLAGTKIRKAFDRAVSRGWRVALQRARSAEGKTIVCLVAVRRRRRVIMFWEWKPARQGVAKGAPVTVPAGWANSAAQVRPITKFGALTHTAALAALDEEER